MVASKQKIVRIAQTPHTKGLSPLQKQFNTLIKKINAQKALLIEWHATIPKYNQKIAEEYESLRDRFRKQQTELVYILDKAYAHKSFKKADKEKLRYLITDLCTELISNHGQEELKILHDKYSDIAYAVIQQESEDYNSEIFKSMLEEMYGVTLDDNVDISSPEKMQAIVKDLQADLDEQQSPQHSQRKKTKKQLDKETKQQQEAQNISLSIREVFRKLTSALHPDREQDPKERERKTQIMQRVNAAYSKKDLLALLELQLEVEQIDQSHLDNIAHDKLKYFNKILKEQLDELFLEIEQISEPFKIQMQLPPFASLSPKQLMQELNDEIRNLKTNIKHLQTDLEAFKNPHYLKNWLKHYRIPEASYGDEDDIFLDYRF